MEDTGDRKIEDVRLDAHSGPIYTAKFNEDGTFIASGGKDNCLKLWNLENMDLGTETEGLEDGFYEEKIAGSAITWIQWSQLEDSQLFLSSADRTCTIFDLNKSTKVKTFKHPGCVNQLSRSKKDTIITACDDGCVRIFDKRTKLPVHTVKTELQLPILTCCTGLDENRFYFSGIDPTIYCYDYRNFEKSWSESASHSNNVTSLSLSPDSSYLLSKSIDGTIKYYDSRITTTNIRSRAKPYVFDGTKGAEEDWLVRAILINDPSSESDELLNVISGSGAGDNYTYVWEFASRKLINKLDGHLGIVHDVDYSEINRQLVSASADGSLIIRNL